MDLNKLPLLLIIVGGATALVQNPQYAQVQLPGGCPKITYVKNIDITALSGWWYRTHSNFKSEKCYNNDGQIMFASQYDNITFNLDMCCRSAADPSVSYCGSAVGSGQAPADVENPGAFSYKLLNKTYSAHVLYTDYNNIDIAYACASPRDELIFVLSREYNLNPTLTALAREVLENIGVKWRDLQQIKHGPTIPYPPLPKKC